MQPPRQCPRNTLVSVLSHKEACTVHMVGSTSLGRRVSNRVRYRRLSHVYQPYPNQKSTLTNPCSVSTSASSHCRRRCESAGFSTAPSLLLPCRPSGPSLNRTPALALVFRPLALLSALSPGPPAKRWWLCCARGSSGVCAVAAASSASWPFVSNLILWAALPGGPRELALVTNGDDFSHG